MGMAGIAPAAYENYAAGDKDGEKLKNAVVSKMTVAALRNKINPITKYYDQWDAIDFLDDKSIPAKVKMEVLVGRIFAGICDSKLLEKIFGVEHIEEEK